MEHSLDEERLQSLMFDSTMNLSKQYFTVLQILRTASKEIDETMAEWEVLQKYSISSPLCLEGRDAEKAQKHVDIVTRLLAKQVKQLQERIGRKIEDIKGLRDGVSHMFFGSSCSSPDCLHLQSQYLPATCPFLIGYLVY